MISLTFRDFAALVIFLVQSLAASGVALLICAFLLGTGLGLIGATL